MSGLLPPIASFTGETRWLSNFHMVTIGYDGLVYASTEHAFQAAKTLSHDHRWEISTNSGIGMTCAEAKRFGQTVPLRPHWEDIKVSIMTELTLQKFALNLDLAQRLLATGDRALIEGNTYGDTFWGVCGGIGQNQLGKSLMKVRYAIRNIRNMP